MENKPTTAAGIQAVKDRLKEEAYRLIDCRLRFRPVATIFAPEDQEGDVHTCHCCVVHGCKYSDDDCTVETGKLLQEYECESCNERQQGDW